jgi:hypothetical protein
LAADWATMRLMVRGTRQAFIALRSAGKAEVPTNLRILYRLPTVFVTGYWRRVFTSPRGELWFGPHRRAARVEMHAVAQQLQEAVRGTGRATPDPDQLLAIREAAETSCDAGRELLARCRFVAREVRRAHGIGYSHPVMSVSSCGPSTGRVSICWTSCGARQARYRLIHG